MKSIDKLLLRQTLLDVFENHSSTVGCDRHDLGIKITAAIEQASSSQAKESRRVTVLLSDLRGFTALAEQHSAFAMVEALNRYLEKMSEIIIRFGGSIDKFMGDSIMALFGAPSALDNDIEAALCCAIEMQAAMAEINAVNHGLGMPPLYMGIGINTGEMIAGSLGSHLHREYTVIGDEVNLTARGEAHTLRGQILLSEQTYHLAKDFIDIGDINEVAVKGKRSAIRIYELAAIRRPHLRRVPRSDIRKNPRVDVDMPLTFQLLRHKTVLPEKLKGQIANISYGGMNIISGAYMEPFSEIRMMLAVSLLVHEHAEVYARVLRRTSLGDEFQYRIEFTSIDSPAEQALKEFVDRLVEIG